MADNVLADFFVALGWKINESDQKKFHETVAKTEKTLTEADKRIAEAQRKQAKETAEAYTFAIGKLALVVTAAVEAGRAIGRALSDTVSGFERLHFVSGRTNASVTSLKALSYAFGQVGGSTQQAIGAVESFSRAMRTNPGLRGFVKGLGVDQTKDTVDQMIDTVAALQRSGYEVGSLQAQMLGIDEGSYNIFIKRGAELKQYNAEYKTTLKELGLDADKAGKSSAQFMQALGSFLAKLEAVFDKLLTDNLPVLTGLLRDLGNWFKENQPIIGEVLKALSELFRKFGTAASDALKELAAGLKNGETKQALMEFKTTLEHIGDNLERVAKVIKVIIEALAGDDPMGTGKITGAFKRYLLGNPQSDPGGLGLGIGAIGGSGALVGGDPAVTGGGSGGAGGDQRNWWQRHAPKWAGGKAGPVSPLPVGSGTGTGHTASKAERAAYIRQAAIARGIDPNVALRVAQSEGFDNYTGDQGRSFGDWQLFTGGGLGNEALAKGINVRDPSTWKAQTDYALEYAKKHGWGSWHGAGRVGIGNQQGLDYKGDGSEAPPQARGDAMAPAGTPAQSRGTTMIRSRSGIGFRIDARFAENFQGFIDDYEAAGGRIGKASGGLSERPGNASYHPIGRAIDVNQIGRGVRSRDQNLSPELEDQLAAKWGLRSGNSFRSNDAGHFEVHNAAVAAAVIERMRRERERGGRPAGAAAGNQRLGDDSMFIFPGNPADAIKAPPMGASRQSFNSSSDHRAVHQQNHYAVNFHGVPDPHRHAHAFESSVRRTNQITLENAQSAIA